MSDTTIEQHEAKWADLPAFASLPVSEPMTVEDIEFGCDLAYLYDLLDAIEDQVVAAVDDTQCEGHESLAGEHMGEAVYCDGSCRPGARRGLAVVESVIRHVETFGDSAGIDECLDWPVDRAAELLDDWRYGPVRHGAYCPCGSRLEIRGELDSEDYEAINDFDYAHQDCTADQDEAVAL